VRDVLTSERLRAMTRRRTARSAVLNDADIDMSRRPSITAERRKR
jgi:hypothetical protein